MLLMVYLCWGSTAPAMRIAVATLPPWTMMATRFLVAGSVLWLFVRWRKVALPSGREWAACAITGIILLVTSNGVFAWSLQYIPAGLGSLFFSLTPLWMALFGWLLYREQLTLLAGAGLVLGLAGMAYLIAPGGAVHPAVWPTVAALWSSVGWAFGSLAQRWFSVTDIVQSSAMQMLCACPVLWLIGHVVGEHVTTALMQPIPLLGLAYLAIFGSIVGYSSYLWLMRNVSTTLASTYNYVNPIVAVTIGTLLLHETLSVRTLIGGAVIIFGVALMIAAGRTSVAASQAPLPAEL